MAVLGVAGGLASGFHMKLLMFWRWERAFSSWDEHGAYLIGQVSNRLSDIMCQLCWHCPGSLSWNPPRAKATFKDFSEQSLPIC